MALVYNEDEQLLHESATGFFADKAPISAFRSLRDNDSEVGYSADLWNEMKDMGFTAITLAEEQGGSGFGYVGAGIVAETMAKTLVATPFFASSVIGLDLLKAVDSPLVEAVASGETIATLAIDETGHHAPDVISTKATSSGDGWLLSGMKTFVPDGHVADTLLVTADTGDQKVGLFLVDRGADKLIVDRTTLADNRNWAKITFEGTPATLLASDAMPLLSACLDRANCILAAELLGLSQAAFDMTLAYLKERKQFGKIIGSFQALQHRAAHLFSEIEVTRSAVLAALQAIDYAVDSGGTDPQELSILASVAKARASATARLATNESIQMHGGIGMTDEYDVGFFIKRARAIENLYGGYSYHCDRYARLKGY